MNERTYSVRYQCGNCDNCFDSTVAFGKAAPEKTECPKCGCKTGKRKKPSVTVAPADKIVIHTQPAAPSFYPISVPYYIPTPQPQPSNPYWKPWVTYCGSTGQSYGTNGLQGGATSTLNVGGGAMGISTIGGVQ